ncbi:MAG TPA: NUDIX hydrolase, partial [Sphingomonas sp.]
MHQVPSAEQSAALPFRFGPAGECEVLLVTSPRRRRWILPKENVEPPLSPALLAAKEAFEEAGVAGVIASDDIGSYWYEKWRADGRSEPISVQVFPLAATSEAEDWPERLKRQRRWLTIAEAGQALEKPELRAILLTFARSARRAVARRAVARRAVARRAVARRA